MPQDPQDPVELYRKLFLGRSLTPEVDADPVARYKELFLPKPDLDPRAAGLDIDVLGQAPEGGWGSSGSGTMDALRGVGSKLAQSLQFTPPEEPLDIAMPEGLPNLTGGMPTPRLGQREAAPIEGGYAALQDPTAGATDTLESFGSTIRSLSEQEREVQRLLANEIDATRRRQLEETLTAIRKDKERVSGSMHDYAASRMGPMAPSGPDELVALPDTAPTGALRTDALRAPTHAEMATRAARQEAERAAEGKTAGELLAESAKRTLHGVVGIPASVLEGVATWAKELDEITGTAQYEGKEAQDLATARLGRWMQRKAEELFPTDPELQHWFIGEVFQGGGSTLPFMGAGIGARALGGSALASAGTLGVTAETGAGYREARDAGAPEEQARDVGLIRGPIGATEALPIAGGIGKFLRGFNPLSIAAREMGEEGTQEFVQHTYGNVVARETYDPDREVLEGSGRAAAVGATVGAGLGGAGAKAGELAMGGRENVVAAAYTRELNRLQQKYGADLEGAKPGELRELERLAAAVEKAGKHEGITETALPEQGYTGRDVSPDPAEDSEWRRSLRDAGVTVPDEGPLPPLEGPEAYQEPEERRGTAETKPGLRRRLAELADPSVREELADAYRDDTSGLANKKAFQKARERLDADPDRKWLLIDLTNFKAINDNEGWDAGNDRIREVADVLKEEAEARGVDARDLFRPGGDEFGVSHTDEAVLQEILEATKARVPDLQIGEFTSSIRGAIGSTWSEADASAQALKATETGPRNRDAKVKPEAPEVEQTPNSEVIEERRFTDDTGSGTVRYERRTDDGRVRRVRTYDDGEVMDEWYLAEIDDDTNQGWGTNDPRFAPMALSPEELRATIEDDARRLTREAPAEEPPGLPSAAEAADARRRRNEADDAVVAELEREAEREVGPPEAAESPRAPEAPASAPEPKTGPEEPTTATGAPVLANRPRDMGDEELDAAIRVYEKRLGRVHSADVEATKATLNLLRQERRIRDEPESEEALRRDAGIPQVDDETLGKMSEAALRNQHDELADLLEDANAAHEKVITREMERVALEIQKRFPGNAEPRVPQTATERAEALPERDWSAEDLSEFARRLEGMKDEFGAAPAVAKRIRALIEDAEESGVGTDSVYETVLDELAHAHHIKWGTDPDAVVDYAVDLIRRAPGMEMVPLQSEPAPTLPPGEPGGGDVATDEAPDLQTEARRIAKENGWRRSSIDLIQEQLNVSRNSAIRLFDEVRQERTKEIEGKISETFGALTDEHPLVQELNAATSAGEVARIHSRSKKELAHEQREDFTRRVGEKLDALSEAGFPDSPAQKPADKAKIIPTRGADGGVEMRVEPVEEPEAEAATELDLGGDRTARKEGDAWVVTTASGTQTYPNDPEHPGYAVYEAMERRAAEQSETEGTEAPSTTDRLDAIADAARERIRKRGRRLFSGVDPADLYDYAVIGAVEITKGTRDVAAWTAKMVKEFGEGIRPYLDRIRAMARDILERGMKPPTGVDHASGEAAKEIVGIYQQKRELADILDTGEGPDNIWDGLTEEGTDGDERADDPAAVADDRDGSASGERPGAAEGAAPERGPGRVPERRGDPGDAGVRAPAEGERSGGELEAGGARGDRDAGRNPVGDPTPAGDAGRVRGEPYRIEEGELEDLGGPKTRARQNIAAIRIIRALEAEGRPATREEQAQLVRYVGWGGLAEMFPTYNFGNPTPRQFKDQTWYELNKELRELLSEEEYATARKSTTNAHYTSEGIIRAIYDAVERLGVRGRPRIIEPGAGVGHFIGFSPLEGAQWTAVEMDGISAAITKALYPNARVEAKPYQDTVLPDDSFDVAVGNVPFEDTLLHDARYGGRKHTTHDYFFVKTLDKVRPGGVVALITSTGTMDKANSFSRSEMAKRADLIGAIRLPAGTFGRNANTEVTTDIIFLRKRMQGEPRGGPSWHNVVGVKGGKVVERNEDGSWPGGTFVVNEYFATNPDKVLGEFSDDKLFPGRTAVTAPKGADLEGMLRDAIRSLPEGQYTQPIAVGVGEGAAETVDTGEAKEGQYIVKGTTVRQIVNGKAVDLGLGEGKTLDRITRLVKMGEAAREVLRLNTTGAPDAELEAAQAELRKLYNRFVKKYGPINKKTVAKNGNELRPNLNRYNDPVNGPIVVAIESYNEETGQAKPTAFQTHRLTGVHKAVENVDTAWKGLVRSLIEHGRPDMEYISGLYGKSEQETVEELGPAIYRNPLTGLWETSEVYLSGNVREKLAVAEEFALKDEAFHRNVEALREVQPEDMDAVKIKANRGATLGVTWIPSDYYVQFIEDVLGMRGAKIEYRSIDGTYSINQGHVWNRSKFKEWSTSEVDALKLVGDLLNQRTTNVWKEVDGGPGVGKKKVHDVEAEMSAEEKKKAIQERFAEWAMGGEDIERTDTLVRRYNDLMNNIVLPSWDGSHLQGNMPGQAKMFRGRPLELGKHQLDGVWRYLASGNTLLAWAVGAGKTITMVTQGMEAKRMGLVRKPMYVVPNHMLGQFSRELLELYPAAKILVADDYQFHSDRRREFLARVATDDWDAVILTHSSFGMIPTTPELEKEVIDDLVAEYEELLADANRSNDRFTIKALEKALEKFRERMKELTDRRSDDVVYWEDLGIDLLFLDEAHEFKNLALPSTTSGMAFPAAGKTTDLYIKTRHLERVNPGRGIVFATATPISNSIGEMYVMKRYLMEAELMKRGYRSADAWAKDFVEATTEPEYTATGTIENKHRPRRYRNPFTMAQLFRTVADVLRPKDLEIDGIPPMVGGEPEIVIVPGGDRVQAFVKALQKRWETRPKKPAPGDDGVFPIVNDGRYGSISARMVTSVHAANHGHDASRDWDHTKAEFAANRIYDIWKETKDLKGTQLVFSDLGVPKEFSGAEEKALRAELKSQGLSKQDIEDQVAEFMAGAGDYDVYNDVKARLVAMGVPADEIAFVQETRGNKKKRQRLFDQVKSGKVRVLMGSTLMMGQGTNVQDRIVAVHHLDVPWKPAWVEQRDGRGIRQGNELFNDGKIDGVRIIRYILKGSFDTRSWQIIQNKAGFIEQGMTATPDTGVIEEVGSGVSAEEFAAWMKAQASDNPYAAEEVEVGMQITRLKVAQREHKSKDYRDRQDLSSYRKRADELRARVPGLEKDVEALVETTGDAFEVEIGGKVYRDRKEAGEAIIKALKDVHYNAPPNTSETQVKTVGRFAGLRLRVQGNQFSMAYPTWALEGEHVYKGQPNINIPQRGSLVERAAAARVQLETLDPVGVTRSLENMIQRVRDAVAANEEEIGKLEADIEATEARVGQPFPGEAELERLQARHAELKKLMEAKPQTDEAAESAEAEARKRIEKRGNDGTTLASFPGDLSVLVDYAIVGAAHLRRGVARGAAWTRAMVSDFGEWIRPYLDRITEIMDRMGDALFGESPIAAARARLEAGAPSEASAGAAAVAVERRGVEFGEDAPSATITPEEEALEREEDAVEDEVPEIRPIGEPRSLIPDDSELDYSEEVRELVKGLPRHLRYRKDEARKKSRDWAELLTEEELEDIGAAVEGVANIRTGKSAEQIQQEIMARTDKGRLMRKVLREYRKAQEEARQDLNAFLEDIHGEEYIKYLDGYLAHFYAGGSKKRQQLTTKWSKKVRSAAKRTIPTLEDAVNVGLTPITQNVAELHRMWAEVNWRGAVNQRFVTELAKVVNADGMRVIQRKDKAPHNWIEVDHPAIQKVYARKGPKGELHLWHGGAAVDPDIWPYVRQVFDQPLRGWFVSAVEGANAWSKNVMLSFSFFHHFALTESAQATLASGKNPIGGLVQVGKDLRGGWRLPGGIKITAPHREGLRLLESKAFVRDATLHGLNVDPIPDVMVGRVARGLRAAEAHTRKIPVLNWMTRGLRRFKQGWDKMLWDHYHTGLKVYSYYAAVSEAMRLAPENATAAEIRAVKEYIARYLNNAYGGQEWTSEFKLTPKGRQALHFLLLAPDWTLSNLRIATDGLRTEKGAEWQPNLYGKYWRNFLLSFGVFLSVANRVLGGRWPWENDPGHLLDIDVTGIMRGLAMVVPDWLPDFIPGADDDDDEEYGGRRFYIKPGKQAREVLRYFTDPVSIVGAKLSPVVSSILEQATGHQPGQIGWPMPWAQEELGWYESLDERVLSLAEKFVPFAFRGNNFAFTFPLSKGMSWYKAQRAYEDLILGEVDPSLIGAPKKAVSEALFGDLKERLDRAAVANGLDPEEQYNAARGMVRARYYSEMWKALEDERMGDAEEAARILSELGVEARGVRDSGLTRGIDRDVIQQGIDMEPFSRPLPPERPDQPEAPEPPFRMPY